MDAALHARFLIITTVQVWAHDFSSVKCTLHILSALPYPNNLPKYNPLYSDGPDIVPAAYLAVEMINNRSDILQDYHLELVEGHDGCGSAKNTPAEILLVKNIFYAGKNVVGFIGPRCYASAEVAGLITAKDGIALPNIHASSSTNLGDTSLYTYSFGATPSFERFVDAYIALVGLNKWKHVGILFQDDTASYLVFQSLNSKLKQMSGYEVAFSSIITDSYFPLDALQASSARAILVITNSNLARRLMCIASPKHMVFPSYQWTFAYRVPEEFVTTNFVYRQTIYNCTHENLLLTLKNSIVINFSYEPNSDDCNMRGISGLTYPQYQQEYARAVQRYNNGYYGPPLRVASTTKWGNPFHDAVWILALALNATDTRLKEHNKSLCEYGFGQPSVTRLIKEEVSRLDFLGVGGRIRYSNGSRFIDGVVNMWQVISNTSQPLGYFDENDLLQITHGNASFLLPSDQKYLISLLPSIFFLVVSVIAIILTVVTNILNVIFRNHESVKASSHRLNHIAYVGSYLLSASIIMLTLTEGFSLPLSVKNVICNGLPWVSSIGFTAVNATVTVKLFRIYRLLIIAAKKLQKPNGGKIMRDSVLLVAIAALLVPDIVICTVWQIVDPVQIKLYETIEKENTVPNLIAYESCLLHSNQNFLAWLILFSIYKGILCGVTTFVAFLTRSISAKHFKTGNILLQSTLQLMSCGIAIPALIIINMFTSQYSHFILFMYITICLLLSSFVYICLFLLFLPPLIPALRDTASCPKSKKL